MNTKIALAVLALAGVVVAKDETGQGADGNPHGWDRSRRCDGSDYDPPCGICEGYGGIPSGDENDEIVLTTCSPANETVDKDSLIQPIWAARMTMDPYYSVQIGPKKDPFCFQAIPENASTGALCYQPQTGDQSYDMTGQYNTLRFDVNLKTGVGNVTSAVIAQSKYLWIVNTLPLNIKQCICTAPKEGGAKVAADVFPLQFNWTNRMSYIGRENIGVEYVFNTQRLDHWNYGPHHVWTVPETGSIIRMWQPFNGLQVMPNGTLESDIDEEKFKTIPPKECTSADKFVIKIKCGDDGYPANTTKEAVVAAPVPAGETRDTPEHAQWRAETKVPRPDFKGANFGHMSAVLNGWLDEAKASTKPCDQWSVEELQKLQGMLYMIKNADYDDIYQTAKDNRRMQNTVEDMEQSWTALNAMAKAEGLGDMHRDGHCHEAVMWYVHHLAEDVKDLLSVTGLEIPLLSAGRHECPEDATEAQLKICQSYNYKVSCSDCHADVGPAPTQK